MTRIMSLALAGAAFGQGITTSSLSGFAADKSGKRFVLCNDAGTGKTVWQREFDDASYKTHKRNSIATSTPCVDAERLYLAWATPANLVVQVSTEPPGLDLTASPASAIAGVVFYNVQEALIKVDRHGKLVPWLADRFSALRIALHGTSPRVRRQPSERALIRRGKCR